MDFRSLSVRFTSIRPSLLSVALLAGCSMALFTGCDVAAAQAASSPAYLDPSKPIDQRVSDLCSRTAYRRPPRIARDLGNDFG